MPALATPPVLLQVLQKEIDQHRVALPLQVSALSDLFDIFTRDRGRLAGFNYLDDPKFRLAYLRYHLPLNVARSTCVLENLLRLAPHLRDYRNIVDLGAGPGSSSLATLLSLPPDEKRRFLLTDRSRGALRIAKEFLSGCAERADLAIPRVSTRIEKLPALPSIAPRSLIWMAMVLNELRPGRRGGVDWGHFMRRLESRIKAPSTLVFIEPALREPALRLLEVHDAFAASSGWRILAPCTHQRACPLLRESGRPWCHFHFDWEPGKFVEDIARPLKLNYEKASFSFLAVERIASGERSEAANERRGEGGGERARVVSDEMKVRYGKQGVYICREGERETLESPAGGLRRGDLIELERGKASRVIDWPGSSSKP